MAKPQGAAPPVKGESVPIKMVFCCNVVVLVVAIALDVEVVVELQPTNDPAIKMHVVRTSIMDKTFFII
jgi:hypothetical protein